MKKLKIIVLILIVCLSGYTLFESFSNGESKTLESVPTLIDKQNNKHKEIQSDLSKDIKVYLDPFEIAPLSALITFKTEDIVKPTIIIKGQHGSDDLVQEFDESAEHYIPVYGLFADTNNEVILKYEGYEEVIMIQTEPVPEDLNLVESSTLTEKGEAFLKDDFYFFTPASKGYTSAFDKHGNLRWYLTEKLVWEIRYLENGNLLLSNETLINPPYYTTGFYELSMLGKIEKEYIQPGGYHHDVTELPNGNLIVASNDFENDTVEDVIVEIDRKSGDVVKTIDLKDILDQNTGGSENWIAYDWFHNNSVWYDLKTNSLTLSGRHQDSVVNLDYDTLEINYIVGDKENHHENFQKYFLEPINELEWNFSQHAAKILPNGDLFMFDNGVNRSKNYSDYLDANDNYSRGVIYRIDQEHKTIEQVFEYGKELGKDHYSSYVSDVDYLDEDHYLIHSGGIAFNKGDVLNAPPGLNEHDKLNSITTELYKGEVIFKLEVSTNYYRAEKMNIYQNTSYSLNEGEFFGSLSKTEADKESTMLFKNTTDLKSLDEAYDLAISKEFNRLVVSGNFNKDDEVTIVLKQGLKTKEYKVRISEKPYTAMCIVIFDDQKQSVTKYINDSEDLSGDYELFIKINNKLYDTESKIEY